VAELRSQTGLSEEDLFEEILPGKHGHPEHELTGRLIEEKGVFW
jgi:hypothetical protein